MLRLTAREPGSLRKTQLEMVPVHFYDDYVSFLPRGALPSACEPYVLKTPLDPPLLHGSYDTHRDLVMVCASIALGHPLSADDSEEQIGGEFTPDDLHDPDLKGFELRNGAELLFRTEPIADAAGGGALNYKVDYVRVDVPVDQLHQFVAQTDVARLTQESQRAELIRTELDRIEASRPPRRSSRSRSRRKKPKRGRSKKSSRSKSKGRKSRSGSRRKSGKGRRSRSSRSKSKGRRSKSSSRKSPKRSSSAKKKKSPTRKSTKSKTKRSPSRKGKGKAKKASKGGGGGGEKSSGAASSSSGAGAGAGGGEAPSKPSTEGLTPSGGGSGGGGAGGGAQQPPPDAGQQPFPPQGPGMYGQGGGMYLPQAPSTTVVVTAPPAAPVHTTPTTVLIVPSGPTATTLRAGRTGEPTLPPPEEAEARIGGHLHIGRLTVMPYGQSVLGSEFETEPFYDSDVDVHHYTRAYSGRYYDSASDSDGGGHSSASSSSSGSASEQHIDAAIDSDGSYSSDSDSDSDVDDTALLKGIGERFALADMAPIASAIQRVSGSDWQLYLADVGHALLQASMH